MAAADIEAAVAANAQGPQSVSGDSGSMSQHNLKDQIEAAKFARECERSSAGRGLPFRMLKITPPGAV